MYWILNLEDEGYSIWDLWTSDLRDCRENVLYKIGRDGQQFSVGFKKSGMFSGGLAPALVRSSSIMYYNE